MNSMFARLEANHPELLAFLVGRYGVQDRSPVHNTLQNRFLDESFCFQFAMAGSANVRKSAEYLSRQLLDIEAIWTKHLAVLGSAAVLSGMDTREAEIALAKKKLLKLRDALLHEATQMWVAGVSGYKTAGSLTDVIRLRGLDFEVDGADVFYWVERRYEVGTELHRSRRTYGRHDTIDIDSFGESTTFRIEVKPILGDDYPAVLRTMKATNCTHLLVMEYCGVGASWDEVVKVFSLSKIVAVLLEDVEQVVLPSAFKGMEVKTLSVDTAHAMVNNSYEEYLRQLPEA